VRKDGDRVKEDGCRGKSQVTVAEILKEELEGDERQSGPGKPYELPAAPAGTAPRRGPVRRRRRPRVRRTASTRLRAAPGAVRRTKVPDQERGCGCDGESREEQAEHTSGSRLFAAARDGGIADDGAGSGEGDDPGRRGRKGSGHRAQYEDQRPEEKAAAASRAEAWNCNVRREAYVPRRNGEDGGESEAEGKPVGRQAEESCPPGGARGFR